MAVRKSDIENHADYIKVSEDDALEHVEVWEHIPSGLYFIWDDIDDEFRQLLHGMSITFMQAAEDYEERKVEEAGPVQKALLSSAIADNDNHRSRLRGLVGDVVSTLIQGITKK